MIERYNVMKKLALFKIYNRSIKNSIQDKIVKMRFKQLAKMLCLITIIIIASACKTRADNNNYTGIVSDNVLKENTEDQNKFYRLMLYDFKDKAVKYSLRPIRPKLINDRLFQGSPNARYIIIEYTDFMCPACASGDKIIKKLLKRRPNEFKVYVKHYPSNDLGITIALYFEALGRQNTRIAWQFRDKISKNIKLVKKEKMFAVMSIINELDVDREKLIKNVADLSISNLIESDIEEAIENSLNATPTYLVEGIPIEGPAPIEYMEKMINIAINISNKNAQKKR